MNSNYIMIIKNAFPYINPKVWKNSTLFNDALAYIIFFCEFEYVAPSTFITIKEKEILPEIIGIF